MVDSYGSTWNTNVATEAMSEWSKKYGNQIDIVISNNDSMAMGCLQASNYPSGVPIFGYDADINAVDAIAAGKMTGTVSQNVDLQAMTVLQLIRNALDGLPPNEIREKGIFEPDKYGNKISQTIKYTPETKSFIASSVGVDSKNWERYAAGNRDNGIKQTNAERKKVLVTIYSTNDYFLATSYVSALYYYASLLNLDLTIIFGDGKSESSCLEKFSDLEKFDAYAINMVKTDSAHLYTDKLSE